MVITVPDEAISARELKKLVRDMRVLSGRHIVSPNDPPTESYRILPQPLQELIIEELVKSPLSTRGLSKIYGVDEKEIKHLLFNLTNDSRLLLKGYVVRRVGRIKVDNVGMPEYLYNIVSIPIEARIYDPTLGLSLLAWDKRIEMNSSQIEVFNGHDIFEEYRDKLIDYWQIPAEKIDEYYVYDKVKFIGSSIGPLPYIEDSDLYHRIRARFIEDKKTLSNFRFNLRNIEKTLDNFLEFIDSGCGIINDEINIPDIQHYVIKLADMHHFCREHQNNGYHEHLKKVERINELFFNNIFLNY